MGKAGNQETEEPETDDEGMIQEKFELHERRKDEGGRNSEVVLREN